ncbi:MAG: pantoate--beta-alanine ligase [Bacteroidia bacterium]|nr:pantoate--beta-alanine ligase [Bacteroidia bacterium]
MLIYTKITELQAFLRLEMEKGQQIGFVPTMGALHQGHISLIQLSKKDCHLTVCSIFVNPTQFNDKGDLARYPRTPEEDTLLLEQSGCDVLFMPGVQEMYPTQNAINFDFGHLDKILEGKHRPGHFNGVAQVVKRFFEIVQPHKAFFGSKDYQQVMIVKALVKQMNSPIEIVACPILREPDGLAMSSRNVLLSAEERAIAAHIPRLMQQAKELFKKEGISAAKRFISEQTGHYPLMRLDYYEWCNANTLQILSEKEIGTNAVSLIAVFVGKIRLIDNLI